MSSDESVTEWIVALKGEDEGAAQKLYERYIEQLIAFARHKLGGVAHRVADEEDIVQIAFENFFRGVQEGKFPRLKDRSDLWQVLVMLAERKATDQKRRLLSLKRGGGQLRGESVFNVKGSSGSEQGGIADVMGREPTPEFAAEVTEEFERLLDLLKDDELRAITTMKLEGYSNDEIGQKLGYVTRTIERKLELIRRTWFAELSAI